MDTASVAPSMPLPPYGAETDRQLPAGWLTRTDEKSGKLFYVDAIRRPPHSIWVHPLDDPEYIKKARKSFNYDKLMSDAEKNAAQETFDASYFKQREKEYDDWVAEAGTDLDAKLEWMKTRPYAIPPPTAWGGPDYHQPVHKSLGQRLNGAADGAFNLIFGSSWPTRYGDQRGSMGKAPRD
ncbi:hypothetical protein DL93DRAFT_2163759 [Clavulina sp. PMI_390]|nr:hypothetical protein DL93DRAFT_2163759 [Clavulina sp. PMI_390]